MPTRRCAGCGQPFHPDPRVPRQAYCSLLACQRERRRRWQQSKRQSDPDYRDNQMRAQQAWATRHPDYWRAYRSSHPDYVERNRMLQQKRNTGGDMVAIAKMAATTRDLPLPSGIYHIRVMTGPSGKKSNVWQVEIRLISEEADSPASVCKEST